MCVIAAKPEGVAMPSIKTIENMWFRNPDGAGFMYAKNGNVHIEKGFMKLDDFLDRLERLEQEINTKKCAIIMHFRITTHGGTKPSNCHPFPITESVGMLQKLTADSKIGVAHNGIINNTPRKGISDTMEYIASQLAPLYKAVPQFYKNRDLMKMIENAITSKMAFLDRTGRIYTIGEFVEEEGIMYSNKSYEGYKWESHYLSKSYISSDENWEMYGGGWESCGYGYSQMEMMWLDEGDYIKAKNGELYCGDFAIDRHGDVYAYNYDDNIMEWQDGAEAFNEAGLPLKFDEEGIVTWEIAEI